MCCWLSQPQALGFSFTVFMPPDGPDGEFSLLSFSTEPSADPGPPPPEGTAPNRVHFLLRGTLVLAVGSEVLPHLPV